MTDKHLTCAECDELFLDYFEGTLDDARRTMVDAHAAKCARCQGLIRDIQGITETAANLPDLEPSRDLWQGVADRIQPAVVAIGYRREGISLSRRVIGLAAAALVVVSSSVTYLATRAPEARRVTESPSDMPNPDANKEVGRPAAAPAQSDPPTATETPSGAQSPSRAPSQGAQRRPDLGGSAPAAPKGAALASVKPISAADAALAPEIEQLQTMLKQRRDQLDPSTIKVVEDNLALIDAAVQQARAALLRDPASGFLTERLDNALQKKIELLRTVAQMPSRS
jgi:hypothetical protein